MTRPPARCSGCLVSRVAWAKPRVDYCYACLPGGPFTPPPCRHCGSGEYFSQGMCGACHPGGPSHLGSCRGCLAWGVYRQYDWRCWSCRWWKTHYPDGQCRHCGRATNVGESGTCRLCWEQGRMLQEPGRAVDLVHANRHGQQLFLANMAFRGRKSQRLIPEPRRSRSAPAFAPVTWQQLPLFDIAPDPKLVRERALAADDDLLRYCTDVVREHAATHGWSKKHRNDVIASLRLLQTLRHTPGAMIKATDVAQLPRYGGTINSTLDVLTAAGLLIDDRSTHVQRYFAERAADLPDPMRQQLETWLEVMLDGSDAAPRRRSRTPQTTRIHILGIAPIVHAWAVAGHQSLAEITTEQVLAALPASGSRRNWAEFGLRSLFSTLKARKLIFTDPTRGIASTPVNTTMPLPLDTATIREALDSPDPALALSVALVAFHALTDNQLRDLKLTDIVDGRLALDARIIPLAEPVRVRLAAWLDYRARKWPNTINPHLIINQRTAPRLLPTGRGRWQRTNVKPQALREDRILQEIHATGGDVRRICDLFGITVATAMRYAATLGQPEPDNARTHVPRTRDPK